MILTTYTLKITLDSLHNLRGGYKLETAVLFLINDIILNITPNYFIKQFKKNYINLDKVLQNDRIVSVMFKVKLSNGDYRF